MSEPWYRVARPRLEVREGRSFNPDEFAIALEQVVAGTAPEDYVRPEKFFARTYFTRAMREQIGIVLRRLAGETAGAPPVLSFVTPFGGGKTHTLTALWHLAADDPIDSPEIAELLAGIGLAELIPARRAVFVGNAWDPRDGRETPWLDLAGQIAGADGPAILGPAARHSPPGTEALGRLFAAAGAPVLILMDEVLNFINRHREQAEPFHAFLDNLVRAATGARGIAVVLSLPKSAVEMTSFEQDWQERITRTARRVARELIAVDDEEISQVIRRRLFEDPGPPRTRARIARTYAAWCFERRAHLPPYWTAAEPGLTGPRARAALQAHFEACYPFHPATLTVFARKWQTLPQFQRTRATLGLLALWLSCSFSGDHRLDRRDALITLGSAPLDDRNFRAVVLAQLGEPGLDAAIEADIVGGHSRALDADTRLKLRDIHRRVGSAILFEGAGAQADAAAHVSELRFALGGPGVDTTSIDLAAEALEGHAFYMRRIGADGYRIDARPKLNKLAAERRAALDGLADILPELRRLVAEVFAAGSPVPVIACPEDGADIADTPGLVVVAADPSLVWDGTPALRARLAEWTLRRGSVDRLYPASFIWCLRKPGDELSDRVAMLLAWRIVARDLEAGVIGEVDQQERRGIHANLRTASAEARDAVWSDYRFMAIADREAENRLRVIDLGAGHGNAAETLAGRLLAALRSQGLLAESVGAGYLERKWPASLVHEGAWPLAGLRQSFLDGSLPRLADAEGTLRASIAEWVREGDFGFLSAGLVGMAKPRVWYGEELPASEIRFDADAALLRREAVEKFRTATTAVPAMQHLPPTGAPLAGGTVSIRIVGEVPAELWNRLGIKLIPKLRAAGRLTASISLACTIDGQQASEFQRDIEAIIEELGLDGQLGIEDGEG